MVVLGLDFVWSFRVCCTCLSSPSWARRMTAWEAALIGQVLPLAEEGQLPGGIECHQQAAEQAREHPHRQQDVGACGDPALFCGELGRCCGRATAVQLAFLIKLSQIQPRIFRQQQHASADDDIG